MKQRFHNPQKSNQPLGGCQTINVVRIQGFTLIEIMIALAIVSIAILAIADAMNNHTQVASGLEKRVLASWVAANQIAQLKHDAKLSKVKNGTSSDTIILGGHKWRVQTKIKKTDVERVFLLTVTVKDEDLRQDSAYASLTTALSDSF